MLRLFGERWPEDSDGDVLRRLKANGFDFGQRVVVDFYVEHTCPDRTDHLAARIFEAFPSAEIHDAGDSLVVQLQSQLTYDFVVKAQERLRTVATPYGGSCDGWGLET